MRRPYLIVLACVAAVSARAGAQQTTADVQTAGGVHSAVFRTAQGSISVYVSSDAAPGDTISGVVLADPGGETDQEREANLGELHGLVVEWEGQESNVSDRRYEWRIPAALPPGGPVLVLRDAGGRAVSQVRVPVDPVPPVLSGDPERMKNVDLPTDGQPGRPGIIRGQLDGTFTGKTVTVGTEQAELLASSPRQLVFRIPANAAGAVALRFQDGDRVMEGAMRVLSVRLTATNTQLLRGQTATLTATVTGLRDLADPVTLTLTNRSADVVRVEDGNAQTITIQPRQVQGDGTFVLTRRLTGIRAGGFQLTAVVARPPLTQFDAPRAIDRVYDQWQARTGVRISSEARDLIRRSVLDARQPLEAFLRDQQARQASVQEVFESLLTHYCFDLRDDMLETRRSADLGVGRARLALAVRQAAPDLEIAARDVRRWSFREFLSRLISRLSTQPVGYLVVSSQPERAPITIDGQRKSEVTNRRFVTSVGEHLVVVGRSSGTCREMVTIGAFQTGVVACGQ